MSEFKTYTLFKRNGERDGFIFGSLRFVILPTLAVWDGYHYEGEYDDSYYFFGGEPIKRPENPTTLEGLTLKNVPENSTIMIDTEAYEHKDGGTVELSFNLRGTYSVRVESFPYLDKEFTIDYQP